MKTVKIVAEQLGVSEAVVYRLIEAGKLKAHRIGVGRGTLRVSDAQLEAYLSSTETTVAADVSTPRKRLRHLSF